ncbi:MAG: hypothetical protein GVY16_04835 [Planctomycetes bacterium]|nr:hypothetical protein [Planctomycetota bacterium]
MAINGSKKAAMLLMTLDPASASQLLSVVKPETATEIATEMAYLNGSGQEEADAASHDVIKEFCTLLQGESDWGLGFVKQMLDSAMGEDRSAKAFQEVKHRLTYRDPFAPIRSAGLEEVFAAIDGEPPQVVAVVLAELPAKESGQLLQMMDDDQRNAAIAGMAGATNISIDAKVRVAGVIHGRLSRMREGGEGASKGKEQQLRKVSVLLRGLPFDQRTQMVANIREQDQETGDLVMKLMVMWEDIPIIGERALQEAMRSADLRKLALAMHNAETPVTDRIKMNMSESARNMLYEESLLITSPKPKQIDEARELILSDLRELNEAGMLEFEGEE